MQKLSERQEKLLDWLRLERSVSIAEIERQFEVSPATAYRDARALVEAGEAVKTSGGVRILTVSAQPGKCAFCGGSINARAAFVFQMADGTQREACCPHCGLMAIEKLNALSALASDFLYGRMVNARQAVFLLESSVHICCSPSVLCFASQEDARHFQAGFGGELCLLDEAVRRVSKIMEL